MATVVQHIRFPAPHSIHQPSTSVSSGSTWTPGTGANASPLNGGVQVSPIRPAQQPFYLRPSFRFKAASTGQEDLSQDGPGRRLRKNVANVRKHIDYVANVLNHVDSRLWQRNRRDRVATQSDILYQNYVTPPASTLDTPVDCVLTKFVRAAMNKVKCPVYAVCWTPEGKRLITGASSGEFTLWNGTAFNFETILQAHDTAVRALKWSHSDQWLASADNDGFVKYWQPNMNNVHMFQAHKDEPIRSLSFAPTDTKLATGSDDGTARIWDFARCVEERVLRGHGSDVRSVDWHPTKGLVVTGSRDSQQPVKIWDPKTGHCLATLHDHKNSVMAAQWNRNGNWLLTGSRDHLIKLYDIRMMRELQTFRAHKKEVTSLSWHPVHEGLFVSGGGDGSLGYWMVNADKELALLESAHDQAIWTLEWHPLGHILATGSNDNNTKFWARNRPGDTQEDIFGLAALTGHGSGVLAAAQGSTAGSAEATNKTAPVPAKAEGADESAPAIPGMGLDEDIYEVMNRDVPAVPAVTNLPGLGDFSQEGYGNRRPLLKQPPPKKAQRQFERMWNVAKPTGGDADFGEPDHFGGGYGDGPYGNEEMMGNGGFRWHKTKSSLLGPPPPQSGMGPPPPNQGLPPPGLQGSWRNQPEMGRGPPPGGPPQGPMGMGGGPPWQYEQRHNGPPSTGFQRPPPQGAQHNASHMSEDVDLRDLSGSSSAPNEDVDLRQMSGETSAWRAGDDDRSFEGNQRQGPAEGGFFPRDQQGPPGMGRPPPPMRMPPPPPQSQGGPGQKDQQHGPPQAGWMGFQRPPMGFNHGGPGNDFVRGPPPFGGPPPPRGGGPIRPIRGSYQGGPRGPYRGGMRGRGGGGRGGGGYF